MNQTNKIFILLALSFFFMSAGVTDSVMVDTTGKKNLEPISKSQLVFTFDIKEEIGPGIWRKTQKALKEAKLLKADLIIIHMNTYGGMVQYADSIRSALLRLKIPVYVLIDDNAASAGALISLACDSIYMVKGATIGAATVVTQDGAAAPDKYQSYMRKKMRATAESHGKDTIINEAGDTIYKWRRNPDIAEGMVDQDIKVDSISEEGKVITFTTDEALKYGYCEAVVTGIPEVLKITGHENAEVKSFKLTGTDKIISFLINPAISGILLLLIIGGIYFELQSPGIGFPLAASVFAAILYFAPLYLEGLAENWEIVLFILGLILIGIEIFAIPGFGIAGAAGIILAITGLALSLVDKVAFDFEFGGYELLIKAFGFVIIVFTISFFLFIWLSKKILTTPAFAKITLQETQDKSKGFVGTDYKQHELIGQNGIAHTDLRPSGRIKIDEEIYDAISIIGFIEKGESVKVKDFKSGQLYVLKK